MVPCCFWVFFFSCVSSLVLVCVCVCVCVCVKKKGGIWRYEKKE